jgi:hypothetical protein
MDEPLSPKELARIRINMLRELERLPATDDALSDDKIEGILKYALLAYQSAGELSRKRPKPTLLWNEELNPALFLARTLLLADHVFVPDRLLADAVLRPTNQTIRDLAKNELQDESLIRAGRVISVPNGVAMGLGHDAVTALTKQDLQDPRLIKFTYDQLVFEGPTAREALIVNAKDDLHYAPQFWLHGRIDPETVNRDDRSFGTRMLQPYDPAYDYRPWIDQVTRDAVTYFIQRSAERLTTADLLGAEYVAASPFEARLLSTRSAGDVITGPASAGIWANVPGLANLKSRDLARMLDNDEAVEDLRGRVRVAVATSTTLSDQSTAIAQLAAEIEQASTTLERKIRTERAYSGILPTISGGAGLMIGAAGGVLGLASAGLGILTGFLPYLGSRRNNRREASYLFVMARRGESPRKPRR